MELSICPSKDLPLAPDWIVSRITRKHRRAASKDPLVELDAEPAIERARAWLAADAPEAIEGSGGNNTTFKVACTVKDMGVSEATCYDLLLDWNEHKAAPPWPAEDLERIVLNAYTHGTLAPGAANPAIEFEPVQLEQPARQRGLYYVDFDEGAKQALDLMAEPLIDEVLNAGDLSAIYGPSNSGKTFVALDMAYHVATGRNWHGDRAAKLGLAIYVATEGSRGIFKRIAALKKNFNDKNVTLCVVPCPINLLDSSKEADTKKLIDLIREAETRYGQSAALITIDTLSRALAGGDENASTDMGVLIRHVDKLRAATKAHVMLVHHTGKDTARGARGWSGIRAAIDTEIELLENRITVTKQRDIEAIEPIAFKLAAVDIGHRRGDGKKIASCVVEYRDAPEFDLELTPTEEKIFNVVKAMMEEKATRGEDQTVRNAEILGQAITQNPSCSAQQLSNALKGLHEKGCVKKVDKGQWVIP